MSNREGSRNVSAHILSEIKNKNKEADFTSFSQGWAEDVEYGGRLAEKTTRLKSIRDVMLTVL